MGHFFIQRLVLTDLVHEAIAHQQALNHAKARVTLDVAPKQNRVARFKAEADRIVEHSERGLLLDVPDRVVGEAELAPAAEQGLGVEWRVEVNLQVCDVHHTLD